MAQSCPAFPTGKVKEIIEKTNETGKEHAFVRCGSGEATEIVEGGRKSLDISAAMKSCDIEGDGPVEIIHTHPNGADRLSDQDRKVAASEHVESVCVAVDGGDVKCEMIDSCRDEIDT